MILIIHCDCGLVYYMYVTQPVNVHVPSHANTWMHICALLCSVHACIMFACATGCNEFNFLRPQQYSHSCCGSELQTLRHGLLSNWWVQDFSFCWGGGGGEASILSWQGKWNKILNFLSGRGKGNHFLPWGQLGGGWWEWRGGGGKCLLFPSSLHIGTAKVSKYWWGGGGACPISPWICRWLLLLPT